jgi:DoxX-like family
MSNIRWNSVALVLLAISFAYIGVYLLGPDHIVKAYVQWGYPPWAHFVAGALFLSAAVLLPFRRTRWPGAIIACCVLALAAATCALHRDYAHAIQGPLIIALIVWLVRARPVERANSRRAV